MGERWRDAGEKFGKRNDIGLDLALADLNGFVTVKKNLSARGRLNQSVKEERR